MILVSALGPNSSFFLFGGLLFYLGVCWDRDLDLDQGLTIIVVDYKKLSLMSRIANYFTDNDL